MVCKNCKRLLPQQINFCNGCGAKVIKNRLTMRNLFEDFAYRYLNYDNQFLRTFVDLFKKPEVVIDSYINGTRKKHINVISYFAIALTLSGFLIYIQNKFFPEIMDEISRQYTQNGQEEMQKDILSIIQEFNSILYMLFVPFYALMSKLTFFNIKKYNFTEHLVINMYASAHFSIFTTLVVIICLCLGVSYGLIAILTLPLQIIYTAYVFKRMLNISFSVIVLRTLLFLVILTVVSVFISILGGLIMFLTGSFDEMIEAKKAIK